MTTYCANCDTEAVVRLTIKLKEEKRKTKLPLCTTCHTAFEWGEAHGQSGDTIEENDI